MDKANKALEMVFVGSPLLDIYTDCEREVLEKYGLKLDGCVRATQKHDALFEKLFMDPRSYLAPGGSALNSARVAKWFAGHKAEVAFAGCVGCDDYEQWTKNQLVAEGVVPLFVKNSKEKTGVCACLMFDGMRSLCTRLGAAAKFSKEHLYLNNIRDKLKSATCIFVVGYFLGHSPDVVSILAEQCSPDQVFSLSLSSEYICSDHSEALLKVLPRVDVLFGNETEVKAFAQALKRDHITTVEEAIKIVGDLPRIPTFPPRILVVTRGSQSVLVHDGTNEVLVFKVPEDVPVVHSVGCGDALAGAFLANYILTRHLKSSVEVGIQAAVHVLQVQGCNPFSKGKSNDKISLTEET
ncbi:adenosine kinase [Caerostris darwini]|uniref:Adenosine kinase n=1 Tax=Caerostris darwini TaxID=1538125 RepID=A0AAV4T9C4_9ARAC|nr:adenosine kinase [Caerostris darwini]